MADSPSYDSIPPSQEHHLSVPASPTSRRRSSRRPRPPSVSELPDENTSLLRPSRSRIRIQSPSDTPGLLSRSHSFGALSDRQESMTESKYSIHADERVWYDQFTSTDWVHDSIADAYRVKALRSRRDFWGRLNVLFDGAQGWILSAVVGFLVAVLAYCVDVAETTIYDYKDGYCARAWYLREKVTRNHLRLGACS
ncbi:hypothetical protein F4778DRAFT_628490 [Xylariomycetidae sp. FL2044]|nr:hypothetical protein F4778DRAFT_628490 [Xylariomycetidae sp. FL2044]